MPTPRSPRAMALSIAPSLISTDPDCASRRKTSPVATPSERSASSAVSTVASFVSRSLISAQSLPSAETRSRLAVSLLAGRGRGPWARSDPLVARTSFQFPAHHDRGDADRWLGVGDRRSLPVLAACPGGVTEIAPDHVDLAHELRALADERRSAEWLSELTVADAVALCYL